ncbi:MAG: conserved rane protein of unknown function [Clostridiales bacterium]|nr:conserved rane protein of unknown function [Clostridiales bacterium]
MERIYSIFDYFKEAFQINRSNKNVYRPQFMFIGIRLLMLIGMGIWVYSWIDKININTFTGEDALYFVIPYIITLVLILIAYGIISVILESGLYNMYKKAILLGKCEKTDFSEGVRKYFFKFFLGKIIIFLAWVVISPIYLITGVITLSLGFTLVPLLVDIFLTMWKISLVMNDSKLFDGFKDSFKFAKLNLLPLSILQIIHWAFVKGISSSGSVGNFSNVGNTFNYRTNTGDFPIPFKDINIDREQFVNIILKITKIVIAVLIPVITIAALAAALVKMLFEVFFSLVLFIAYTNKFIPSEIKMVEEVQNNVV